MHHHNHNDRHPHRPTAPSSDPKNVSNKDLVCGMDVDPIAPRGGTFVHDGQVYGFCSARCRTKFAANPGDFLSPKAEPSVEGAQSGGEPGDWICPMHPEVQSDRPGSCPICGMALE